MFVHKLLKNKIFRDIIFTLISKIKIILDSGIGHNYVRKGVKLLLYIYSQVKKNLEKTVAKQYS